MNVLFLDQFSEMGGGQRCLLDIVHAAKERGWGAHVLVPGDGPLVEQLRAGNADVGEIPCGPYRSGSKSPGDFLRFALDIRRQVRVIHDLMNRVPFDLIYVNGPRLLPAAALASSGRVPLLFHAHSRINQASAAHFAGWSIRRSGATVAVCSNSAGEPLRPYVRPGKLHVIPNGTSEIAFRERTFRSWRIGIVGRISPEKGQMEFLRAVALLQSEFPDAQFVLRGAPILAAQSYFNRVRDLASELSVELAGWTEDIASVFGKLDLLVVPSKEEGMPRVVLEAFSAGVPVVAFPAGGIPEVIEDEKTGFLVPEATPEALAAKIRELVTGDPATLQRVAANARGAWERSYTLAAYQTSIMDLVSVSRAEPEKGSPRPRR